MMHPENEKGGLSLSCPTCAASLKGGSDDKSLECEAKHCFTLESLLLAQSIKAGLLFSSGLTLLDQQVKLVRAIALEHSITKPDAFLQLEMKADQLEDVVTSIKEAIKKANE